MVARERVLFIGIFTGLFGLSLLGAVVVVYKADSAWRFAALLVPLAFAGAVAREFRRSVQSPDESVEA